MRISLILTALVCLAFTVRSASAADYARIDRTIAKEPQYKSKAPRFCLLLFGREAKTRMWVVLDENVLYIDRNADGDITGADERVDKSNRFKAVHLADPDGKTHYVITHVSVNLRDDPPQERFTAEVDIKGPVEYSQYCDTALEENPRRAAIAHYHAPLTIGPQTIDGKVPADFVLETGSEPAIVPAIVGTMNAEYGVRVFVRTHSGSNAAFPKGVIPYVDVEFPPAGEGATIKKRYPLEKFC
ncbi:MAG: hypothetical protein WD468_07435 [Pirellulales bacterium]